MKNLVSVVGLSSLVHRTGLGGPSSDFEEFYSRLVADQRQGGVTVEVERKVDEYFSALSLPAGPTIYDRILVSLRPKDAVFTFNWDPFLFDAYERNRLAVPLPEIFFLHGNVRIGTCPTDGGWGQRDHPCGSCSRRFSDVRLLYPIGQKDYSQDPYIRESWEAARNRFAAAFTLTVFGYGAPTSDRDAVELLRSAWLRSPRQFEHIEIIDVADSRTVQARWAPFAPTRHLRIMSTFDESRLAHWPRRSCEAVWYPMSQGVPCEHFPLPRTESLQALQEYAAGIARHENL